MNSADKEYHCNSLLVKALLQFLPAPDRKKAHEWLQKLDKDSFDLAEVKIRNEYIAYLLVNVQNGRLLPPFDLMPPCKKLRPLSKILQEHLYEEAMKQFKLNFCLMEALDSECEPPPKPRGLMVDPPDFHREQPHPHKGIVAYCTAFSNSED